MKHDGMDSQDFLVEKICENRESQSWIPPSFFIINFLLDAKLWGEHFFFKLSNFLGVFFFGEEMQKPPGKHLDLPMAVKLEKLLRCMWLW